MFKKIFFILALIILPFSVMAQERSVPDTPAQIQLSYAPIVKQVAPAVVNIYTKRTVATGFSNPFANDPFFGQFFDRGFFGGPMRERVESSLGSGVILSEDGLVVTNAHVVKGAEEITVVLSDGNEYQAALSLSDEASDLALLRIQETGITFPHVTMKPSETLEVGDLVLAIGNPFGVGQTVTSGIVSAQGRSSLNINDFNFFIQTDAAINPGNSGGPLVAMDGKVVGINTAIYSRTGGSHGIGFSIPSEMVASVVAAELSGQRGDRGVVRPWLGVEAQDMTSDIAMSLGLDRPQGALVSALHSASPFKKAGVNVGDVIVAIKDTEIRSASELKFRFATVPIGQSTDVEILRDGEKSVVQVKAIAPPDDPPRNEVTLQGEHALRGVTIGNINPAVYVELGLRGEEEGVVVLTVPQGSYASRVIRPGDILLEINSTKIKTPNEVEKALSQSRALSMIMNRGGRITQLYIQ
ncbi:MAG: Do family serine endopeptidase [Alphaproteobacteria bacterium]|nr:Do family serine endopeptidase [Alphaproteobacteria bacterium]